MRYLAELPWVPQAMAVNRQLEWLELDRQTVEVATRVGTACVAVRLEFDAQGDIVGASTESRSGPERERIVPGPRGGHGLQAGNPRGPPLRVFEYDAEQRTAFLAVDGLEVGDEVVLLQQPGDLKLHFRCRHVHATVLRSAGIADPREHNGDRASVAHFCSTLLSLPQAGRVEMEDGGGVAG